MSDLADDLHRGARLFDAGEFFAAHEAWEDRWRIEVDPDARRLLQGLIQVAAGFHKLLVMGNPASALRLLARGLAKLDASTTTTFDLAAFRTATRRCATLLSAGRFDRTALPVIGLSRKSLRE